MKPKIHCKDCLAAYRLTVYKSISAASQAMCTENYSYECRLHAPVFAVWGYEAGGFFPTVTGNTFCLAAPGQEMLPDVQPDQPKAEVG